MRSQVKGLELNICVAIRKQLIKLKLLEPLVKLTGEKGFSLLGDMEIRLCGNGRRHTALFINGFFLPLIHGLIAKSQSQDLLGSSDKKVDQGA